MYNTETKIISAPVGLVADIATALGVGSGDLGYLCSNQHGKTNKWSRFKPICRSGLDLHLLNDYENGGTLYQGVDQLCGLNIPYTKLIKTASSADKYFNGEMKWGYNAPEPNATHPARALDFDGYYSAAIAPIDASTIATDVWLENNRFTLGLDIATTGTKYNLGLADIDFQQIFENASNITEWYPGLLFRKAGGAQCFAITSEDTLGDSATITFENEATDFPGTWKVVPFLTETPINTLTGDEIDQYYIGLDVDPFELTIHKSGTLQYGLISIYWIDTETRQIGFTGEIINDSSSVETVEATLYVYVTATPEENPAEGENESGQGIAIGTYVVQPDGGVANFSTTNEGGDIEIPVLDRYRDGYTYWAGISIDGGTVPFWTQFEEQVKEE